MPNGTAEDVWSIYRTIRDAAPELRIKPKVIQTLAALISCLKPRRGMICFASNSELQRRLAGLSEKTIRRHIKELADAEIVRRQSSPNGKRYCTRDPESGAAEAYGIDLSPMVENAKRWQDALET
ncbi:helix-turn-helix domain-containing protein, partial [Paracoccus sp. (in: a-proteobacteria)]|uniref:helix-turn-helix domain-containing protein n=1 Tax=Paracoccus sp. TaxID=267 RepID=UPI00396CB086